MKYDPKQIKDFPIQKTGTYLLRGLSARDFGGDNSPLVNAVTFAIVEPESAAHNQFRVSFWLGSEEDTKAEEISTRTSGRTGENWARRRRFLRAAGIPETGDTEEENQELKGVEVLADIVCYAKKDEEGNYTGELANVVRKFMKPGTKQPEIAAEQPKLPGQEN